MSQGPAVTKNLVHVNSLFLLFLFGWRGSGIKFRIIIGTIWGQGRRVGRGKGESRSEWWIVSWWGGGGGVGGQNTVLYLFIVGKTIQINSTKMCTRHQQLTTKSFAHCNKSRQNIRKQKNSLFFTIEHQLLDDLYCYFHNMYNKCPPWQMNNTWMPWLCSNPRVVWTSGRASLNTWHLEKWTLVPGCPECAVILEWSEPQGWPSWIPGTLRNEQYLDALTSVQ